jgi:hypothetical protein
MTRVARREIDAFMGADMPVGDMIGMSELGYLGFECHKGRRYNNDQDFYLEFVQDGRPVEIGTMGELYVTTLDDTPVPRIRYATGDYFTRWGTRATAAVICRWCGSRAGPRRRCDCRTVASSRRAPWTPWPATRAGWTSRVWLLLPVFLSARGCVGVGVRRRPFPTGG